VVIEARSLAPKPTTVDFVEAAAIPQAGLTSWQALFDHGRLEAGQTVVIHGAAGGVGAMGVQLARWAGAHVVGTGRANARQRVLDLGGVVLADPPVHGARASSHAGHHRPNAVNERRARRGTRRSTERGPRRAPGSNASRSIDVSHSRDATRFDELTGASASPTLDIEPGARTCRAPPSSHHPSATTGSPPARRRQSPLAARHRSDGRLGRRHRGSARSVRSARTPG
jgi:hypothetical protein